MEQSPPDSSNRSEFKYWAFISYSHRDKKWGDWLHKALETYRVPRRLVGRESRDGTVPKRVFPVFRDREELPGSPDLGQNITRALEDSRYLIVICSPQSAGSLWVNEEIKYFKSLGRDHRVLCIIVEGEPNATDKSDSDQPECFPEAVRYRVDQEGRTTDERTEPIAADARPGQDGRANARLKLLAGVLGIDYDNLRQRERIRRRQRRTIQAAALLLIGAGVGIGWHLQHEAQLEKQAEESRRLSGSAFEAINTGKTFQGLRLAIEAMPESLDQPNRPLVPQALAALHRAHTSNRLVGVLKNHETKVRQLSYNADGSRLLSVSLNEAVLWNPDQGEIVDRFQLPGTKQRLWFTGDGERVVLYLGGPDTTRVEVRDANDGSVLAQRKLEYTQNALQWRHDTPGHRVAIVPYTPQDENTSVKVWDVISGNLVATLETETDSIEGAVFLPKGRTLLVHGQGASLYSRDGKQKWRAKFSTDQVHRVATGGQKYLALAQANDTVVMLDLTQGEVLWQKPESEGPAGDSLIIHPDGNTLYSSNGMYSTAWDRETGQRLDPQPDATPKYPHAINTDPLVIAGGGNIAGRINVTHPPLDHSIAWTSPGEGVSSTAIRPDGKELATAHNDYSIRLWKAGPGFTRAFPTPGPKSGVVTGAHGTPVVWHDADGRFYRQDAKSENWQTIGNSPFEGIRKVQWLEGSGTILELIEKTYMAHQAEVRWRHFPEGTIIHQSGESPVSGDPVITADSGNAIAYESGRRAITVVSLSGDDVKETELEFPAPDDDSTNSVSPYAIDPEGNRVAATVDGGRIVLRDVESGNTVAQYGKESTHWYDLAFGPEGTLLAALGTGGITIWKTDQAEPISAFDANGAGSNLDFSSDGRRIMTTEVLGDLRIWTVNGDKVATVPGVENLGNLVPGPNGRYSLYTDDPVRLFSSDPEFSSRQKLTCGDGAADRARWGPEGQRIALVQGYSICIFDVAAKKNIFEHKNLGKLYNDVLFNPEGDALWSLTDGHIYVWPLYPEPDALLKRARTVLETYENRSIPGLSRTGNSNEGGKE